MLHHATHGPNVALAEPGPTVFIQPIIPYAFAFALGHVPARAARIPLGKDVMIAVADGTCAPHDPRDWFAARVPVVPAVTGPLHVDGVRPGDTLEIDVIALEPDGPGAIGSLLVTIVGASERTGPGAKPLHATIPAGGAVRMKAQHPGGLIAFGPVLARQEGNGAPSGDPVAARLLVRCTIVASQAC
jgi:hypothetical protein